MTAPTQGTRGGYVDRPAPSSLADTVQLILDKGLVIDAYVRVSLLGVQLVTIDARVVVASVDTYLRFAEATNRLDLAGHGTPISEVPKEVKKEAVKGAAKGVWSGVKDEVKETVTDVKHVLFGDDA
jgi:gas vesicle structural protein